MASTGGNPDPLTAWQVVMTLGVLATIGVNLLTLARGNQTQKREVTLTDQFVTKDMCEKDHGSQNQRFTRIEAEVQLLRDEMRHDRESHAGRLTQEVGKVHDRVNDVLEAVSELRGEVKRMSEQRRPT